jgi:imidazolonepropionase-like amidohydrolase
MKHIEFQPIRIRILLLLACVFLMTNGMLSSHAIAQKSSTTAFVNVNVIPMDTERVLENQTVIVEGDHITAIGPADEMSVPKGAKIIKGNGNYLMPGLADMHFHFFVDPDPDFMRVPLAEGVTTVRNISALPEHQRWKDEVNNGERVGPTIYTSGPMIVGPPDQAFYLIFWAFIMGGLLVVGLLFLSGLWLSRRSRGQTGRIEWKSIIKGTVLLISIGVIIIVTKVIPINLYTSLQYPFAYIPDTEEGARAEVQRQAESGYDFIKVYDYLTRGQYFGVIDEAKKQGIYVIGHLDHGIEDPLAEGLDEVVHVDEFMDEHLSEEISPRDFKPVTLDYKKIPQTVKYAVENDVMVVSNMVTDVITYEYLEEGPAYFKQAKYKVIRPETIEGWLGTRMVTWQGQQGWRRNTLQPFYKEMIKSLHAAGVPILIGTDTGVEGNVPSDIHRDLELLVDAGLSPYEALEAGTKNAGISVSRMGKDGNFGTIEVGKRADCILLENNPLDNVSNTINRLGVMVRGHWYTQDELDTLVDEFVSTY